MADSIESLMAQLGGNNYSAPSSYRGYQSSYKQASYKPVNLTPYNFTQKDFGSLAAPKKSSGNGINLWDVLSGTLGQAGGAVTNSLYNTIHDIQDKKQSVGEKIFNVLLKDSVGGSLVQGAINGGKEQWKDWTDGKMSWGDIPAVGFLHGADKGWKRGTDIAKDEFGIKNRWGQVGTGIGLDVALDPLTYLTGGLSAAGKLSKAAELAKTAELAQKMGIVGKFKKSEDFITAATDAIRADHIKRLPNVSPTVIDRAVAEKVSKLAEEIKTAKNTTFNDNINKVGFGIPFTNKMTLTNMSKKSLNYRTEAKASQSLVDDLIHKASFGDANLKPLMEQMVKARYGVDHTGELSKTMFDDLHAHLSPIIDQAAKGGIPDVTTTQKVVEHAMPQSDFTRLMDKVTNDNVPWKDVQKQLDQILTQTAHDPALRSTVGSQMAKMVSDYWMKRPRNVYNHMYEDAQKAQSMKWVSRFLGESDKYKTVEHTVKDVFPKGSPEANAMRDSRVFNKQFSKMADNKYNEMGNFKTRFEHMLDAKNIFDPRTLATGNKFVDSMGDHISDAHSQRVGETARYSRGMDKIEGFLKKQKDMTNAEKATLMEHAIYVLENHAPDHLGGSKWVASDKAKELANHIRPVIDRIGSQEHGAGVLDKLRANYFPHVVNKDPETMKAMEDFAKRHKEFNGTNSKSKFNKERISFQTLAQRDNYMMKLEKAIHNTTDSATIESLRAQQERVAKMFDTDVVSALQRRIKEGVRAKAMKELQGKLGKYGMMKTIEKGSTDAPPSGLTKLEPDVAKKLGLGEGTHYVHPDVLKGMKRVDEIFTAEGMNKFVRHMTAIADVWRPLVTFYKASHYRNNIIGNLINNMAAGVKISDYKVAGKLITGYRNNTLTEAQMKLMEEAYKTNSISGGFLYDAHPSFQHADPSILDKTAKALSNNKVIKGVRHQFGEKPDDISRLANFINGMNKYGKTDLAAKQVRTYLFNYNELTNADRTMRTIVPFWNWTKRNIPLQMKLLLENPKFAINNQRYQQLFNNQEDGADWQKETGVKIPDWLPIPDKAKNYYTTHPTPVNDLNQLLHPVQFMGSLNPVPKSAIELATNRKLFTGNPISYGSNTVQGKDVPAYVASNLGIFGDLYKLLSGQRTTGEALVNNFNPISRINTVGGGGN